MKKVPCALNGCGFLASVPNEWMPEWPAYCTEVHRIQGEAEKSLLAKGADLGHPVTCPGCCGTGVEDNSRWGADLALCTWPIVDGKPVTGAEAAKAPRDSCPYGCGATPGTPGSHHMNDCRAYVRMVAADVGGEPCRVPPPGWACTRGANHPGPCAAVSVSGHPSAATLRVRYLLFTVIGIVLGAAGAIILRG